MNNLMSFLSQLFGGQKMISPVPEDYSEPTFFNAEDAIRYHAGGGTSDFLPSPTPSPSPRITLTPEQIQGGFEKWGRGEAPPVATQSAAIAELANDPRIPDPRLIPALLLKESGGLKNQESARVNNNPANLMSFDESGKRSLAKYPDLATGILGSDEQKGLKGTILGGRYDDYLKSSNLKDFFDTYSPAGENADYDTQIAQTKALMDFFTPPANAQERKPKKKKKAN